MDHRSGLVLPRTDAPVEMLREHEVGRQNRLNVAAADRER
jgi:hypothetical protein